MDRLGRYQILDPIGSGPCGSVVRAKVYGVVGVDRQFAIKQILPILTANPTCAQALSASARSYGSLEHARIARLAEFTVSQGKTFTATELVIGIDVGRLVAEGRISASALPPGGALTMLSQAARAVGYAHGRGLFHLGLCPQNLLVSSDGDVKVTDFGILAACLPERPVQDPRMAHRVAYLAPEQLLGEPTSAATDVFALGAIAIEMVTGMPAFRGETPVDVERAVLAGHINDPSLPRPIVRVLQRCLARAPFERFPDARAFADALDAALRTTPLPGTRADLSERVKEVMAHLDALNAGGLSGVVSLPSMAMPPSLRPPTILTPEVIATQTVLADDDGLETAEFLREDAIDDDDDDPRASSDRESSARSSAPRAISETTARNQRITAAPMIAATLRGISAVAAPRPMPPSFSAGTPPPPIPSIARAGAGKVLSVEVDAPLVPTLAGREHARVRDSQPVVAGNPAERARSVDRTLPPATSTAPSRRSAKLVKITTGPEPEVATAQHASVASAWDEAMDSFEQPTRLNESMAASLLSLSNRTGPSPLIESAELAAELAGPSSMATGDAAQSLAGFGAAPAPGRDAPDLGGERNGAAVAPPRGKELSLDDALEWNEPVVHDGRDHDVAVVAPKTAAAAATAAAATAAAATAATAAAATAAPATPVSQPRWQPTPMLTPAPMSDPSDQMSDQWAALNALAGNESAAIGPDPSVAVLSIPRREESSEAVLPIMMTQPPAGGRRWLWMLLGIAIIAGSGISAFAIFGGFSEDPAGVAALQAHARGRATAATSGVDLVVPRDPATARADIPTADGGPRDDAEPQREIVRDAAASPATNIDTRPRSEAISEDLSILSKPAGARVYIDGADAGVTPLRVPGPPDRHSAVLFLDGYDLAIVDVDKGGTITIDLKEITPIGGPAGIKVRCKVKDRYYVYIDGRPTGALCPTERLEVELGERIVEIYDLVSETRRQFRAVVKDTNRSMRVRVD